MNTWLHRIVAVLALSMGLLFLVCPFRDYRRETIERETVEATRLGFVDDQSSRLGKAWHLESSDLSALPTQFVEALESLSAENAEFTSIDFTASMEQLMTCLPPEDIPREAGETYLVRKDDLVFEVNNSAAAFWKTLVSADDSVRPANEGRIFISYKGTILPNNSGWVADRKELRSHPAITSIFRPRRYVEDISQLPTREAWEAFARSQGGTIERSGLSRVIYDGVLYEVIPVIHTGEGKLRVPRLRSSLRIGGGVFALVGFGLLVGLYRHRRVELALRVGSNGTQLAGDLVLIAFTSLALIPPLDASLHHLFDTDPIADEPFLLFMGVFSVVLAVPLVSLYLSMLGSQWIRVDSSGVELHSLFSNRSIEWGHVEEVEVDRGVPVPTARSGVPLVRTLQKSLVLSGQGQRLAVMEASESRKLEILRKLKEHAPPERRSAIEQAGKDWIGYEAW